MTQCSRLHLASKCLLHLRVSEQHATRGIEAGCCNPVELHFTRRTSSRRSSIFAAPASLWLISAELRTLLLSRRL